MNKALSNVQTTMANDVTNANQTLTAPPLPPRKASPNVADNSAINRLLKPQLQNASSLVNASNNVSATSSESITACELDVPKANAPPVPKHNVAKSSDNIDDGLKHINLTNLDGPCDNVIVGPAETISGIIDTRPIETRKPIETCTNLTSSSSNAIDNKEQNNKLGTNNLYHLKMSMQQNQIRHQSYPNHLQSTQNASHQPQPSKSQTTPHLGLEYVKLCTTSSSSSSSTSSFSPTQQNRTHPTNSIRNVGYLH